MGYLALVLAANFALGVVFYRRINRLNGIDRLLATFAPGVVATLCVTIAAAVLHGARFYWNTPRLAVSFALMSGYRMYYGPDDGPVLNVVYPPVSSVMYLPATLAQTTFAATIIEALIGAVFFFGPAAWILMATRDRSERAFGTRWIGPLYGIAFFVMVSMVSSVLRGSAFFQPVDPIAIGFASTACAALALYVSDSPDGPPRPWLLTLSAACAVLAVWSKQTFVGLGVALPLYLGLSHGVVPLRRYLLRLALFAVGISGLLVAIFGPIRNLIFNVWIIPSSHPFRSDAYPFIYLVTILRQARELGLVIPILGFGLVAAYTLPSGGQSRLEQLRVRLRAFPWLLYIWVAVWLLPTSYLGFMKEGGRPNSMAIVTYFLTLGASLCLASPVLPNADHPRWERLRDRLRVPLRNSAVFLIGSALAAYAVIEDIGNEGLRPMLLDMGIWFTLLLLLVGAGAYRTESVPRIFDVAGKMTALIVVVLLAFEMMPFSMGQFTRNKSTERGPVIGAYEFARRHPHQVLLPYDPLSTLLTDHELYHFDYGVFDRRLAGYPVSDAHYRQHLPSDLRYIMYPRWVAAKDSPHEALRYLPEYSELVRLRGFEEWDVYMRPEDAIDATRSARPFP